MNLKKPHQKPSAKARKTPHRTRRVGQEQGRKSKLRLLLIWDVQRVKTSLSNLAKILKDDKQVEKYKSIADQLSTIAKLENGHVWSWRYVAGVANGSIEPGKKFIQAVMLLAQKNNGCKQWFYFVCRHSVAAIYNKCIMKEIVTVNMKAMGYKPVTYTRYMQVKRKAVRHGSYKES
jgi:hypothetical protein